MIEIMTIIGMVLGLVVIIITFALTAPLFVDLLVNNPKRGYTRYRDFYFFSYLKPGEAKVIQRGERFIRCIMDYAGYRFSHGEHNPNEPEYWEVVPTAGEDPANLFSFSSWNPMGWWVHYMYRTTGVIWVGIPILQTIRTYKLERWVQERNEMGQPIHDPTTGRPVMTHKEDVSDHFRVREFFTYFQIPSADTKDKVPVEITGVHRVQTKNPWRAAYSSDRWDQGLLNGTANLVTSYVRSKNYDDLFADGGRVSGAKEELGAAIRGINNDLKDHATPPTGTEARYGMTIVGSQISDFEPLLTGDDQKALLAPFRAVRERSATFTVAEGRAASIALEAAAMRMGGQEAVVAAVIRGQVQVAEAAGQAGGVVTVDSSKLLSTIVAAKKVGDKNP
jgi:hypothetical protein